MKKQSKAENASQRDAFVNAARELGCDEDESRFEETLKKVVRHKSKNEEKSSQPPATPQRSRK
jgi:hypothetical protein